MIYLDHNSTTPLAPQAASAMLPWLTERFGNPASQHGVGRRARRAIEQAREEIARILGAGDSSAQPDQVVFTSGGTEANNLALFGLTGCMERSARPGEIVISAVEHPSIGVPAQRLEQMGWTVHRLPATPTGIVDLAQLDALLNARTKLVSIMLANNETGALQPVQAISKICRARNILMHTDAVQMAGKLPLDFRALGVDAMTVAAHKFHGPLGIGALVLRSGVRLSPGILGGFQQSGLRGGTESVALAVGMQAALAAWEMEGDARTRRMRSLRDAFESELLSQIAGEVVIVGSDAPRLPNTSCIAFLDCDRQALAMALDLAGVACSTGSACASGSAEPSPVLSAMHCDPRVISSALRFSVGAFTTDAEIDAAISRIQQVYQEVLASGRTRRPNAKT